ncbi:hypothetical protein CPB84DRAFT_1762055 [Gymnopilus junonius]|uniref:Uncharacterized protein n=1 Tax=Gymnopilus junonius TaxID=109634 RepID=A0A9P5P0J9_GYMJU|nr:hypothetical protein CPB84DRAFT_1762055 [Gymnopilus junonius]
MLYRVLDWLEERPVNSDICLNRGGQIAYISKIRWSQNIGMDLYTCTRMSIWHGGMKKKRNVML